MTEFLAYMDEHLKGTTYEPVMDEQTLTLGVSICDAFDRGVTYQQLFGQDSVPRRVLKVTITGATTYLCPEYRVLADNARQSQTNFESSRTTQQPGDPEVDHHQSPQRVSRASTSSMTS